MGPFIPAPPRKLPGHAKLSRICSPGGLPLPLSAPRPARAGWERGKVPRCCSPYPIPQGGSSASLPLSQGPGASGHTTGGDLPQSQGREIPPLLALSVPPLLCVRLSRARSEAEVRLASVLPREARAEKAPTSPLLLSLAAPGLPEDTPPRHRKDSEEEAEIPHTPPFWGAEALCSGLQLF